MRLTMTAVGLAIALGLGAVPATAQQPAAAPQRSITISKPAMKAVSELKVAVDANDAAAIPGKLAAAQAAATTDDDRYYIGVLQLKAGIAAKDNNQIAQAIEAMIGSGKSNPTDVPILYFDLGKTYSNLNQPDKAAAALEKAIQLDPNNVDPVIFLAELRNKQGRAADAVTLLQKAIAVRSATGAKVEENWYKRTVSLAYAAKLPVAVPISREWVKSYPSPTNWRDSLRIYKQTFSPDDTILLDLYRLGRATKSLAGEADFYQYAELASRKGFLGEAKAVLDEGLAAKQFDPKVDAFRQLITSVNARAAGDRASLAGSETRARAAAAAQPAIGTADAYYGYGDYAKAVELYRLALTKSGADANLVNLRLGMALARSGDKAGATAALNAVTGPRSELAKFWLLYVSTLA